MLALVGHPCTRLLGVAFLSVLMAGCDYSVVPWFLGGPLFGYGLPGAKSAPDQAAGVFGVVGPPFSENLIQARTFTDGTAVTTVTYLLNDLDGGDRVSDADVWQRRRFGIDFNGDGKIDPVIGYGEQQATIQILLSDPAVPAGLVRYLSLTLDSKRDMAHLADVAVGDIDRDGALDIVAAAEEAVWYFHHPTGQPTTALAAWGNPDTSDPIHERIESSYRVVSDGDIQAMIAQAAGPGINLNDYIITVQQLFTNVEIGDLDNDGDNDIVASRSFIITLAPRPGIPVQPIKITDGDVIAYMNPHFATTGYNWSAISIGRHERQTRLDRDGADALLLYDLDGDGDLDAISAARQDNNVQVAWFQNPVQNRPGAPGPLLAADALWQPWRIGSVRDARGLDVADVTGDGRADVIVTGGVQQQMLLFEQPATGPARSFDWDAYVLVEYESFEPRDVKAFDVDGDGRIELVTGGTAGAVRYYEPGLDARLPWTALRVLDFEPPGDVGLLGYGDLDGDGDLDLVAVVAGEELNDSRITWIRNDLVPR